MDHLRRKKQLLAVKQHGIAEFMGAVTGCGQCFRGPGEQGIVGEGAQELEMAFARLMDAGKDRIDDTKRRPPRNTPRRSTISGAKAAVGIGGRL